MSEASVGLDLTAPPQRVWDVVTDITLLPRWSTELLSVEWAEGFHGPALGAGFVGRNLMRPWGSGRRCRRSS